MDSILPVISKLRNVLRLCPRTRLLMTHASYEEKEVTVAGKLPYIPFDLNARFLGEQGPRRMIPRNSFTYGYSV